MDTYLLTINEVAERVRVNPRTVRRWIDEGKLRAAKVMGNIRVEAGEVDKLVKTEARPAPKSRPDMDAITDKIEKMLAANPRKTKPGETQAMIYEARKGREDAILNCH